MARVACQRRHPKDVMVAQLGNTAISRRESEECVSTYLSGMKTECGGFLEEIESKSTEGECVEERAEQMRDELDATNNDGVERRT
jgi:hypothetical protein